MKKKLLIIVFIIAILLALNKNISHEDEETNDLLSTMTTKEKIAQMIMPAIRFWDKGTNTKNVTVLNEELTNFIKDNSFGGIILFSNSLINSEQTINLLESIQKANLDGNAKTKLLLGVDQEGGLVSRVRFQTETIGNMALGATNNSLYARENAQIISSELKNLGFNLNFAPVLDINDNPNNPIIGTRSFSDDAKIVSQFGKEYLNGMHDNNVITVTKHFMGHGNTSVDSHTNLPSINKTYDELKEKELVPFINTINDTDLIMTAHIQYPLIDNNKYLSQKTGNEITLPASLSKTIITDILRNKLDFNGVVITDAMDMDAIRKHFSITEATKLAINAGIDMILIPFEIASNEEITYMENYLDAIIKMIDNNEISIERINEAVTRIIKLKKKYGLLSTDIKKDIKKINIQENKEKEWQIALQSVTLVKNDNHALPININDKITFIYPNEDYNKLIDDGINKLKENNIINDINIEKYHYEKLNAISIQEIIANTNNVIIISHLHDKDQLNPKLSLGKESILIDEIIKKTHEKHGKTILISANLPYDIARYNDADAIITCYNSNVIPASIYTIIANNNPPGILPANIPKLSSNYIFTDEILYQRGYNKTLN